MYRIIEYFFLGRIVGKNLLDLMAERNKLAGAKRRIPQNSALHVVGSVVFCAQVNWLPLPGLDIHIYE
jgi:hypothetical protein